MELVAQSSHIQLIFDRPGQGPVVRIAMLPGKQFEDDQGQRIIAARQLRVQVSANDRGSKLALADGEKPLQVGPISTMGWQAAEKDLVDRLPQQLAAFQQHPQHFHQQGFA